MFFGEFEHRVDYKGRVPLPARFRREIRDGLVLARGIEKCITAYPLAEWKKLAATVTGGSLSQSKVRRLNRALFGTAFTADIDGQGRITLPAPLKEYAGIGEEVVVIGANTYMELWSKERWQAEKAESEEQVWNIIESLEKR